MVHLEPFVVILCLFTCFDGEYEKRTLKLPVAYKMPLTKKKELLLRFLMKTQNFFLLCKKTLFSQMARQFLADAAGLYLKSSPSTQNQL